MVDRSLDQLFKGGEFDRLRKAIGYGKFGERASVEQRDFIFFDLHRIGVLVGEFIELLFGQGLFFEFFDRLKDLFFFVFGKSPRDNNAEGVIEKISFDPLIFFELNVDGVSV